MASKKLSRGMNLPITMWKDIEETAKLLGYNENQFVEKCVEAIFEMINTPEKRIVPKIVHMADAAKDFINIPIHLVDNVAQQKEEVKNIEENLVSDGDEAAATA